MWIGTTFLWAVLNVSAEPDSGAGSQSNHGYAQQLWLAADEIEAATEKYFGTDMESQRAWEFVDEAKRREDFRFKVALSLAGGLGISGVTYLIGGSASPDNPASVATLFGMFGVAFLAFVDAARVDAFTPSIPTRRREAEELMSKLLRERVEPVQDQLKKIRSWTVKPPQLFSRNQLNEELEALYYSLCAFSEYAYAEFRNQQYELPDNRWGRMEKRFLILAYRASIEALSKEIAKVFRALARTLETPEWSAIVQGPCPLQLAKIRLMKS